MEQTAPATDTPITITPASYAQAQEAQSICPPKHLTLMWGGATVGVTGLIALIYGLGDSSLGDPWEMAYLIYGVFMSVSGLVAGALGYSAIPHEGYALRRSWNLC